MYNLKTGNFGPFAIEGNAAFQIDLYQQK